MPQSSPDRSLRVVVAAVVARDDGRILLARRLPDAHLGGLWEFPGGAVEAGETPAEALSRELVEELGVVIRVGDPITFAFHRDEQRDVVLLFHAARIVRGEPDGRQGQEVRWFARAELAELATPPADAALVRRLLGEPV
ncbi:MAG: (deoxy)nucleoside triphosphate pyrophosphohydrolase [Thermoanaerobaculaceae bacterium]|nr:(deoxy)nucleoside triphosphate pyrophosphohydrolase [Thermoanaerobaculaceae bacterium]TAM45634.1 MAG: (deoxy)nucleoside triphosphate pyrophosphohydrolase [Acidobacteriota bacterium]